MCGLSLLLHFFAVCSDTPASAITAIVSTSTITITVTTGSDAHAQEDSTTLIGIIVILLHTSN